MVNIDIGNHENLPIGSLGKQTDNRGDVRCLTMFRNNYY
jgi:hypothetical protein